MQAETAEYVRELEVGNFLLGELHSDVVESAKTGETCDRYSLLTGLNQRSPFMSCAGGKVGVS